MVDAGIGFREGLPAQVRSVKAEGFGADFQIGAASFESGLDEYAQLCRNGLVAPPQSAEWITEWRRHCQPDLVSVNVRLAGKPVYWLVLEVLRTGPFRIARFPGGKHASGNFPAADPAFLRAAGRFEMECLAKTVASARPNLDLIACERLLSGMDGMSNPLLLLSHHVSPNPALAVDLAGGFDALLRRASGKRKRKKHRSQMRKFEAAGGFARVAAATPADVDRLLDAFFAMKERRFREAGIVDVFAAPAIRQFFRALFRQSVEAPHPCFVLHGLEVGGKLRAVTGSSRSGARITCEFGAISEDELSYASPGEFLFFENIAAACEAGLDLYDFGVGDEPYKRNWCDVETAHFDVLVPLSPKGRLLAAGLRASARAKRHLKKNQLAWSLLRFLRRRAAGQPAVGEE